MVLIVDYGLGNLASIQNMLKRIGHKSYIASSEKEIDSAEKIILPGVGAFDNGMKNIEERNLLSILTKKAMSDKVPIMGICLGMQLLTEKSQEGIRPGLGWIEGECKKFDFQQKEKKLKVPHMGWNDVHPKNADSIFSQFGQEISFYFVHSYHVVCKNPSHILATTNYGDEFTSAVQMDNIFGVQFHPEKSHKFGMQLLKNFCEL